MPSRADSPELAPLPRLGACLSSWLSLFLASPGLVRPQGLGLLAFVALVPWALAASRPGKRRKLVEWFSAACGLATFSYWLWPVLWFVIPAIGIVTALYLVLAGAVLRRLARRFPLALATPLAWLAGELPRFLLPTPLSFGWWRLGTMAHDTSWLAGSMRVWGVFGLSYVLAAGGGLLADLALRTRPSPTRGRAPLLPALAFGLAPLSLAIVLSRVTHPPELVDGPRVLLVQPGIEQVRKSFSSHPLREMFGDACTLTREGLDAIHARGEPPPDLVAWGETMLVLPVAEKGLAEAVERGARPLEWTGDTLTAAEARALSRQEDAFVRGLLFGDERARVPLQAETLRELEAPWLDRVLAGEPLLPPGTSLFAGAEYFLVHEGAVRRQNAAFLWDPRGTRQGPAAKVHLVPGAEDMLGTQELPFFLAIMKELGGYVPDFVAADRAGILELSGRDGRIYRIGVSICYDGAFDDPFTVPARKDLDFHLIASNEAWYLDSVEMDHMVAFARTMAIATGRSVVRATNSGITTVIDPRGREVATLEVDGRRKMVRGTLAVQVPVPARSAAAGSGATLEATFYARTSTWQPSVWVACIVLAACIARRPVTRVTALASAPSERPPPAGRA
jgi:apolipoprotein N-acyltransferase